MSEQEREPGAPPDVAQELAEAAYYKAQARGFAPGAELADWASAETELKQRLGTRADIAASLPDEAEQHQDLDMTAESADDWFFYEYADGRWTWQHRSRATSAQSRGAFDSWIEALADAIVHGFVITESEIAYEGKSRRARPRLRRDDAGARN